MIVKSRYYCITDKGITDFFQVLAVSNVEKPRMKKPKLSHSVKNSLVRFVSFEDWFMIVWCWVGYISIHITHYHSSSIKTKAFKRDERLGFFTQFEMCVERSQVKSIQPGFPITVGVRRLERQKASLNSHTQLLNWLICLHWYSWINRYARVYVDW